ncbi:MAG: DUF2203 domain-containing protein [Bryobacter sp.]|nr:DUF2203 domain-containing protein [Bryobacter sp.]
MQSQRRHFTLDEANGLLPSVVDHFTTARKARSEREHAEAGLQNYRRRLILSGGVIPNANRMGAFEDQAKLAHQRLSRALNALEDIGLEVRDLDQGLVDFPTRYRGETVYLCYKVGEKEIAYWHAEQEGYQGRRLIDEDFRSGHSGDRSF